MPDEPKDNFEDPAAGNDKVHADLLKQGSANLQPEFNSHTADALDSLVEQQRKAVESGEDQGDPPDGLGDGPDDKDNKGAGDDDPGKTGEEGKPGESSDDPPVVEPADDDAPKPDADEEAAKAAEAAAEEQRRKEEAEDIFKDAPKLPEGASVKSHEAFDFVKKTAAQKYKEYEDQLAELQKKVEETEARLADPVPTETKEELEELRKFRARLDIDADPQFQKWGKEIAQSEEFIYAQLLKSPNIDQSIVDQIKSYGGPGNVNMDKILGAVDDSTTRRIVEAKMADIELHKFNRDQAVAAAKKNVDGYLTERQKAWEDSAKTHNVETKKHLDKFIGNLEWAKPVSPKAGASEEEKKKAQAHNSFVSQVNQELQAAIEDDTPKMRATLLTGLAQFFYLQNVHKAAIAERDALAKENKELASKVERFKKASVGRLKDSSAPADGSPLPKKDEDIFSQRPGEALDAIRNQVIAERSRAGV